MQRNSPQRHRGHREKLELFGSLLNNQFADFRILVSILCVLCASVVNLTAQDYKPLKDGIEYAEVTKEISGLKVSMNLLRLDLTKVRLDVVHAFDKAIGVDTTSNMAKTHGAFAAINAGFFRLDKSIWAGDPAGVFVVNRNLLSESANNRSAIGIVNTPSKTEVNFAHLQTKLAAGFGTDSEFSFDGINRERKPNEIILFTPDFNQKTLTNADGVEIVLTGCRVEELRSWCVGAKVSESQGSSLIPSDGLVISIGKGAIEKSNGILYFAAHSGANKGDINYIFRIAKKAEALETHSKPFFSKVDDITNGVPQLIKNGKIDITWQEEKSSKSFVETRHPRTAVAKLKDGKFLMITVDGRTEASGGIGLQDLAEYLLSLGATDAMNLDGGGSTTMFVDGKVVNHPSDKEGERKVSDAILVTPRKKK